MINKKEGKSHTEQLGYIVEQRSYSEALLLSEKPGQICIPF